MTVDSFARTARRISGALFVSESFFSAGYIASITLLSINAVELGGGDQWAGVPSTISLLGRAAFAVPLGALMDRRGRRPGLVLGYLLGVVGLLVSGLGVNWSTFALLCLGSLLAGMGNAASGQARFVAAEVWPDAQRARVIGLIVFASTIGAIGGPLLVGPLVQWAQNAGYAPNSGPYWGAALLALLAVGAVFLLLRPDPRQISHALEVERRSNAQAGGAAETPARDVHTIFRQPLVQLAVASMVVGQLVMTLIMVITPVYMHHLNHGAGEISLVFMAHTLGMFGLATVTGWLIDRLGKEPMMIYGAVLLVVASVMAPMSASVPALAVALFVLGLGWNFCFVAGSALLVSQLHYDERGRVQGTNEVLVALASGAGSLVTGSIFAGGGMLWVGAVGLALTLIFGVFATWRRRGRQRIAVATE